MLRGAPPDWNPEPAGFSGGPGKLPYVLGTRDAAMGYVWAKPLRAGGGADSGNKILWFVRHPRMGDPLTVRAHPRDAERPVVTSTESADSGPGEIYPSGIDVPHPGCWTLELSWGVHRDEVDLEFAPPVTSREAR
ncbi:hypothetical protein P8605_12640 [Streptomyces sp. T-3]|nr:hypothetical protein [Streptomyces sp. T-3]